MQNGQLDHKHYNFKVTIIYILRIPHHIIYFLKLEKQIVIVLVRKSVSYYVIVFSHLFS